MSESKVREGDETLTSRGNIYGPYRDGLDIRENIIAAILNGYERHNGKPMPKKQESYFWDVANKLSRLAVCPEHIDSWHDIVGYAKLIENAVSEDGGI